MVGPAPESEMTKHEDESQIKHVLQVCSRRFWTIVTVVVIVTVSVAVITLRMAPVYRATSQVLIEKENPKVISFQDVYSLDASNTDYYRTQYRLMKARHLVGKICERFEIAEDPQYSGARDPVEAFSDDIEIQPVKNSRLVDISFEGKDPLLTTDIVNAVVDSYIKNNMKRRLTSSLQALGKLSKQIEKLEPELECAAAAIQQFKEESQLVSLEDHQNIIVAKLAKINETLTKAQTTRISLEADYQTLQRAMGASGGLASFPAVLESDTIRDLKGEQVKLQQEWTALSKKYMPLHPKMLALRARMMAMNRKVAEEQRLIGRAVKLRYERSKLEEEMLSAMLKRQEQEALMLNKKSIRYRMLVDEARRVRELYDTLVARNQEIEITIQHENNNISVVDYATVPASPVRPRVRFNIALGGLAGLILGLSLAFLFEHLDNSVKTPEDVERYLKLPLLGFVPQISNGRGRTVDLITHHNPRSTVSEAYRAIRTGVLFSSPDDGLRRVMVTSAAPGEGKTISAINLAITMAQSGNRVLLVDADLRHPRIHRAFGIPNPAGLSNLLVGESAIDNVVRPSGVTNLDLVTSGPIPPNPSELLGSQRMKQRLKELDKRYDRVIFDTPPVVSVTDANVLGTMMHGAIFVIKASRTSRHLAMMGIEQLSSVNVRILGTVLNNVRTERHGYYYSHYYRGYYPPDEKSESKTESKVA